MDVWTYPRPVTPEQEDQVDQLIVKDHHMEAEIASLLEERDPDELIMEAKITCYLEEHEDATLNELLAVLGDPNAGIAHPPSPALGRWN